MTDSHPWDNSQTPNTTSMPVKSPARRETTNTSVLYVANRWFCGVIWESTWESTLERNPSNVDSVRLLVTKGLRCEFMRESIPERNPISVKRADSVLDRKKTLRNIHASYCHKDLPQRIMPMNQVTWTQNI